MIEGIPDWIRVATLVVSLLLVPAMLLIGQRLKRRDARRGRRG